MLSFLRTSSRQVPLARRLPPTTSLLQPKRLASTDYGSKQSGMEQGIEQKNPKADLEHPGPEPPAAAQKGNQSQNQGQSQTSSSSSSSSSGGSGKGSPAIHKPDSPSGEESEDVKQHNKEMENRYEKTENQLHQKDQAVDKNYWQGNVGTKKDEHS